jgi:hypothetical protein
VLGKFGEPKGDVVALIRGAADEAERLIERLVADEEAEA